MISRQKLLVFLGAAFLAAGLAAHVTAQQDEKPAAKRTLIRAGHLLDVKTGKVTDGETIVVVGDSPRLQWQHRREIRWWIWAQ
jgi:hypothetical protein